MPYALSIKVVAEPDIFVIAIRDELVPKLRFPLPELPLGQLDPVIEQPLLVTLIVTLPVFNALEMIEAWDEVMV